MKHLAASILFVLILKYGGAQTVDITGKIINEKGSAVSFASVAILKKTNPMTTVAEKITAEDGSFKIKLDSMGSYLIRVSQIAYEEISQEFNATSNNDSVTITLIKKEALLNNVTVVSKKQLITRKIDRIVMNVQGNAAATGKSSLELFQMAPGVFVNNGEISINGMSGARVMVNGRMLNISGDDLKNYLQNLKANDIKSMEIIAHPPAQYDASGSGGIISIILKKNINTGINGYLGADYAIGLGKYPTYNPSFGLNYKKDKLGLTASYAYNWEKSFQNITQDRDFTDNGIYHSITSSIQKRKSNNVKLGATYDISDHQYITIDYSGKFGENIDSSTSLTQIIFPNAQQNSFSKGSFPNYAKANYSNIGLNYSFTTDTLGSRLNVVADYTYNNRASNSGTNSQTYDFNNKLNADTVFKFYYPAIANIFTADINYNKQFKSGMALSFGGKITATNIANNNTYDILINNIWKRSAVLGFDYNYTENIYAGFANLDGTFLKTEFKLGLRGESSHINGGLANIAQDTSIKKDYFNLFPTVYLKRNLDKDGNNYLSLSYNKRITRPSYAELNPYKYFIDNYTVETGNPFLNPQLTDAFELGYTFKGQYYLSAGYAQTKDVINQVIENSPNQAFMTILRKNTGLSKVFTVTLNAPVKITKWWNSSSNLLLTYTESIAPEFNIGKASFILQTEQDISFSNSLSLNLNGFYTPNVVTGNIVTGRVASVDIGLQKKLFNNTLLAKAAISDVFYTNNFNATSYYNGAELKIGQKEQSRMLTLSLLYNFSVGKSFNQKKIEKSNADEKSRL